MPANEVIKFSIIADEKAAAAFNKTFKALNVGVNVSKQVGKAIAAAGVAVVGFTTIVANGIDKQAKFATRLGESISVLSKYQFIANQAGISTEQFNMASQRMSRRVAEAAKNLGEAKSVLQELGIVAEDFNKLPLDEKLEILADRLEGVTSESDKLRIAMKLFDSEGVSMLQMLKQNSEALKAAGEDAEYLGVVIGPRMAAQSELFSDKMGRAKASLQGLSNSIGGELMPLLTGLADRFANFIAENRTAITNFVRGSIQGFFTLLLSVEHVFDRIGQIFTDFSAMNQFLTALGKLPLLAAKRALNVGKAIASGIGEGLSLAKDILNEFGDYAADRIRAIFSGEKVETIGDAFGRILSDGFSKAARNITDTWSEVGGALVENAAETGTAMADGLGYSLEAIQQKSLDLIEGLSLYAETVGEKTEQEGEKVHALIAALREQKGEFMTWLGNSYTEFAETLNGIIKSSIDGMSAGLAQAIMTGTSLMDVLKNVAKQTLQAVLQALIKLGIQRLLLSVLNLSANAKETSAQAAAAVGLAGANAFASWSLAPWPISMGAPAAAAAAISGAATSFTAGAAIGSALGATVGAVAHGGLTNNPDEQTVLVRRGERIISPRQNQDLTEFLDSGGAGLTVENFNVTMFPNATNADAVLEMSTNEMAAKMEDVIIQALNNASRKGVKPDFAERLG